MKIDIRKWLLLIINLGIYALIDFKSIPILIFLILITYFLTKNNKNLKLYTIISVLITVSTWIFYKSIIKSLPLGLSFYSFKILSYIFDNYKNKINFKKNLLNYFVYITYFPEIVSGPISRSENIITNLDKVLHYNKEKMFKGIQLVISGVFLKFVIANRALVYVDNVFNDYKTFTGLTLVTAAILYSIQIYTDFSGYSNISIGISNMLGIDAKRNFNRPYFATSIKDFWTRWHISLSTWLRDYIYIPLGGNRKGKFRKFINTMITFLVSGFWHGNGSGYIFWGLYHGALNNVNISFKSKFKKLLLQILTFIEVTIGWIFFRLENFNDGINYIKLMIVNFRINYNSIINTILPFTKDRASIAAAAIMFILVFIELVIEIKNKDDYTLNKFSLRIGFYILCILLLGMFGVNKFIYMNY